MVLTGGDGLAGDAAALRERRARFLDAQALLGLAAGRAGEVARLRASGPFLRLLRAPEAQRLAALFGARLGPLPPPGAGDGPHVARWDAAAEAWLGRLADLARRLDAPGGRLVRAPPPQAPALALTWSASFVALGPADADGARPWSYSPLPGRDATAARGHEVPAGPAAPGAPLLLGSLWTAPVRYLLAEGGETLAGAEAAARQGPSWVAHAAPGHDPSEVAAAWADYDLARRLLDAADPSAHPVLAADVLGLALRLQELAARSSSPRAFPAAGTLRTRSGATYHVDDASPDGGTFDLLRTASLGGSEALGRASIAPQRPVLGAPLCFLDADPARAGVLAATTAVVSIVPA